MHTNRLMQNIYRKKLVDNKNSFLYFTKFLLLKKKPRKQFRSFFDHT